MNRPPGPTDRWWQEHQQKCGGTYTKIKEPAEYTRKQEKKKENQRKRARAVTPSVKEFFPTAPAGREDDKCGKTDSKPVPKQQQQHDGKGNNKSDKKPRTDTDSRKGAAGGMDVWLGAGATFDAPPTLVPVVFSNANGDDEVYLVSDIHAVLSLPTAQVEDRTVARGSTDNALVDLTVSDSESEEKTRPPARYASHRRPTAARRDDSHDKTDSQRDVIEIE